MNATRQLFIFVALVSCPFAAIAAEWTIVQPITVVEYDGDRGDLYLAGAARWGSVSCPTATWARIAAGVMGRKDILAISLAAKVAGTPVRLYGLCGSNGYFDASYISAQ